MSSTSETPQLYARVTTQANLVIFAAIVIGIPMAYAFTEMTGASAPSFLLLVVIAIGVPQAYVEHWNEYDRTWNAIVWVLVAAGVVSIEFTALYRASTELVGLPPIHGGAVAFLLVYLGNLVWLHIR